MLRTWAELRAAQPAQPAGEMRIHPPSTMPNTMLSSDDDEERENLTERVFHADYPVPLVEKFTDSV